MPLSDARAILVCVDYHDILSLTLPQNISQFKSVLVVTSMQDQRTLHVANLAGAEVFQTNAFYDGGAVFNKFLALEQGIDYMGREGWLCILDADIAIPTRRPMEWEPKFGCLHTPRRRVLEEIPEQLPEEIKWRRNKLVKGNEVFNGYFHLFHADDPVLAGVRNWHSVDWTWAAGGDTDLQHRWPHSKKVRPPFEVLHIGKPFRNWAGRVTPFADGTVPEEAEKRKGIYNSFMNQRRHLKSRKEADLYTNEKLK